MTEQTFNYYYIENDLDLLKLLVSQLHLTSWDDLEKRLQKTRLPASRTCWTMRQVPLARLTWP